MIKKDIVKTCIDEIYSKALKKNYAADKILYNDINELWSTNLLDTSDYKKSKKIHVQNRYH